MQSVDVSIILLQLFTFYLPFSFLFSFGRESNDFDHIKVNRSRAAPPNDGPTNSSMIPNRYFWIRFSHFIYVINFTFKFFFIIFFCLFDSLESGRRLDWIGFLFWREQLEIIISISTLILLLIFFSNLFDRYGQSAGDCAGEGRERRTAVLHQSSVTDASRGAAERTAQHAGVHAAGPWPRHRPQHPLLPRPRPRYVSPLWLTFITFWRARQLELNGRKSATETQAPPGGNCPPQPVVAAPSASREMNLIF